MKKKHEKVVAMECAKFIKEYCKKFEDRCDEKCVFYRGIASCAFDSSTPEGWTVGKWEGGQE